MLPTVVSRRLRLPRDRLRNKKEREANHCFYGMIHVDLFFVNSFL